ncbi:futalosine hydrolase [Stackebrandtia albiflava]|uniref:futalosine hydrolase n=1 Tax=Stackebrandtia albiflava TaxID=406432 RepID=UPI001B873211|nr:futalosine hydrolase [Stackebrandtia albiflava]
MRLLIVTAVSAEADAVRRGLAPGHEVVSVGVGPAAAAAGTARAIATAAAEGVRYAGVVNAGVAGGLAGRVRIGDTIVATESVSAELGVALADRFQPLDELGFGTNTIGCDPALTRDVAGHRGAVLTLATITGTAELAGSLAARYPAALAEAMEGFGVATAARQAALPFAEIRTVSNAVGDRDVAGWDWDAGFAALAAAAATLPAPKD